jgi:hypothetical protein
MSSTTWMMIPHPNTVMTYMCLAAVPVHATIGGTANWISMLAGFACSCMWGMGASMDVQMNEARRASQFTMLLCPMQAMLVQTKVLKMHKVVPDKIHFGILGGFFVYNALKYNTLRLRREI